MERSFPSALFASS